MRISWLVLLVVLSWLAPFDKARAQKEVLDSLIDLALKNNPELSAVAHIQQSMAYSTQGAGALPDPSLTIGVLNLPSNSFALDETPMSGVFVGLAQKVPWPGKLRARTDLASSQHLESRANEQIVQNRIVREVSDAYLDYAYWSLSLLIVRDYAVLLEGIRDIAEVRYANGEALAQDVLRAGSIVSRTQVRLLQAEQKRYASLLQLRRTAADTTISEELPALLAEPMTKPAEFASIEANPMLARTSSVVEQSETQRRLARLEYAPDITFGIDYNIRQGIPGDPVHGSDFLTFKVGLNLPLWFFAKQKHQVRSANQMVLSSKQREQSVRDMLTAQFMDAMSVLSVTLESFKKYDSSLVPESQAALEAAEIAYEVGEVDFDALLTAQSDVFEIRLERLDLLRQYHKTRAALAELTGSASEILER